MLKLTAPDQIHIFTISYGTRIRKISTRIRKKFLTRIRNLFYTKRADPKSRIGTKHETVPEKLEE